MRSKFEAAETCETREEREEMRINRLKTIHHVLQICPSGWNMLDVCFAISIEDNTKRTVQQVVPMDGVGLDGPCKPPQRVQGMDRKIGCIILTFDVCVRKLDSVAKPLPQMLQWNGRFLARSTWAS